MTAETLTGAQVALGLVVALGVGALVGLERERHQRLEHASGPGGVRTFPLMALAGALASLIATGFGPWPLVVVLLAVGTLLALDYQAARQRDPSKAQGLTTEAAAVVVVLLGALPFASGLALSFNTRLLLCGGAGTVVMGLLALHEPLHGLATRLSEEDLRGTLRFLVLAAVVLPLLPDRDWGPHGSLNPWEIGFVVVLIAGVSFVGYVAVRWLGAERGIGLTAFFGGLVSSTAVTLAFSQKGREQERLVPACALAVVLASAIMFPRVVLEVSAISPALAMGLVAPLGVMLAVTLAGLGVLWWLARTSSPPEGDEPRLVNPLKLRQALKLGAVLAIVRIGIAVMHDRLGNGGLHASAALAGLADVDAISLSTAGLVKGGLDVSTGAVAVTLAVMTNTLMKAGIALVVGGWPLGRRVILAFVPVALAAVAWLVATR
jgi:uncharacterized membrane protein (DUF4010 family)